MLAGGTLGTTNTLCWMWDTQLEAKIGSAGGDALGGLSTQIEKNEYVGVNLKGSCIWGFDWQLCIQFQVH